MLRSKPNKSQFTITIDSSTQRSSANPYMHNPFSTQNRAKKRRVEERNVGWLVSESLTGHGWKDVFFHFNRPRYPSIENKEYRLQVTKEEEQVESLLWARAMTAFPGERRNVDTSGMGLPVNAVANALQFRKPLSWWYEYRAPLAKSIDTYLESIVSEKEMLSGLYFYCSLDVDVETHWLFKTSWSQKTADIRSGTTFSSQDPVDFGFSWTQIAVALQMDYSESDSPDW